MDGKGRWLDNVMAERFWWSLKHEDMYLRDYGTVPELKTGIEAYIERYNTWRPHPALGGITPSLPVRGKDHRVSPETGCRSALHLSFQVFQPGRGLLR